MARKKSKHEGLIALAMDGNWTAGFILGSMLLACTLTIDLKVQGVILKPIISVLTPFGFMLSAGFYVISFITLIKKNTKPKPEKDSAPHRPIAKLVDFETQSFRKPMETDAIKSNQNKSSNTTHTKPLSWSLQLIQALEWKKFEELCIAYYQERGYRAEPTKLGADGGIDIKVYSDDQTQPCMIVQCKAWANDIGVKEMREFLGVMTHEKIHKGIYMSTSAFTHDAKKLATENGITCYTGNMLLMDIKRLGLTSQQRLLMLATAGEYTTPTCPTCGIKMVKRNSVKSVFWGCENYPRGCKQRLHLRKVDYVTAT